MSQALGTSRQAETGIQGKQASRIRPAGWMGRQSQQLGTGSKQGKLETHTGDQEENFQSNTRRSAQKIK